jgi:argininosuccinate lyase
MRGLARTGAMLEAMTQAIPQLEVDRERSRAALSGGTLATDEVMRRVQEGRPFRTAYREVASELKNGQNFEQPSNDEILSRRKSTGGLGNLGLPALKARIRQASAWGSRERKRFDRALHKLAGEAAPLPRRLTVPPS